MSKWARGSTVIGRQSKSIYKQHRRRRLFHVHHLWAMTNRIIWALASVLSPMIISRPTRRLSQNIHSIQLNKSSNYENSNKVHLKRNATGNRLILRFTHVIITDIELDWSGPRHLSPRKKLLTNINPRPSLYGGYLNISLSQFKCSGMSISD